MGNRQGEASHEYDDGENLRQDPKTHEKIHSTVL
jgi:hypothetical protein